MSYRDISSSSHSFASVGENNKHYQVQNARIDRNPICPDCIRLGALAMVGFNPFPVMHQQDSAARGALRAWRHSLSKLRSPWGVGEWGLQMLPPPHKGKHARGRVLTVYP